jgi:hypothetical protein
VTATCSVRAFRCPSTANKHGFQLSGFFSEPDSFAGVTQHQIPSLPNQANQGVLHGATGASGE